jgi:hypothetical protein
MDYFVGAFFSVGVAAYVFIEVRRHQIERLLQEIKDATFRFQMDKGTDLSDATFISKLPTMRSMLLSVKPIKLRRLLPLRDYQVLIKYIRNKRVL